MSIKIWLDDVRTAPPGWRWVRSVNEALDLMRFEDVTHASLDHDLGDYAVDGGDGNKLVLWMCEYDVWPSKGIRVHSANPVGRDNMLGLIDRYGPYDGQPGIMQRGDWDDDWDN